MNYVLVLLLAFVLPAHADELHGLKDEQSVARFQVLSKELRCPKCQNQNLADSNAGVAGDLRDELVRMINEDRSNEEIVDFMVSRYGEFVLYRPQMSGRNWVLWLAPLVLLLTGFGIILLLLRRSRPATESLDHEQQQRLRELIKEDGK